jgi:hypothetical protein
LLAAAAAELLLLVVGKERPLLLGAVEGVSAAAYCLFYRRTRYLLMQPCLAFNKAFQVCYLQLKSSWLQR